MFTELLLSHKTQFHKHPTSNLSSTHTQWATRTWATTLLTLWWGTRQIQGIYSSVPNIFSVATITFHHRGFSGCIYPLSIDWNCAIMGGALDSLTVCVWFRGFDECHLCFGRGGSGGLFHYVSLPCPAHNIILLCLIRPCQRLISISWSSLYTGCFGYDGHLHR